MSEDQAVKEQPKEAAPEQPKVEFEPGEVACAIGNSVIDVIKIVGDARYRDNLRFGPVAGRVIRVLEERGVDDKNQSFTNKYYAFSPFEPKKGEGPMIDPQSGRPVIVELPSDSIFRSAKQATEYLMEHLDKAMNSARMVANNTSVDADKVLNKNRKIQVPGISK